MPQSSHINALFKNKELDELYISIGIRRFSLGIISVFIPLYLYQVGFELASIFLFFWLKNIFHALLVIPAAHISAHIGFKHSMAASIPLLILFFISIYTAIPQNNWSLFIIAIVGAIENALYWTGYHLHFSSSTKSASTAQSVSIARIISSGFHSLGPFIGGILLVIFGFTFSFFLI